MFDTKWNKVNGLHYRAVHIIEIGFVMFEVYYLCDQKSSPFNRGVFVYRVYMKRFNCVVFVVSL